MTYTKFKPKHVLPQLEEYVLNKKYALSLNPCRQYKLNRLAKQISFLLKVFQNEKYRDYFKIELYPELSSTSRFHWHGYLIISNIFLFVRDVVPCIVDEYTVNIKDITDKDVWFKYCTKQLKYWTENYIDKFPIKFKQPYIEIKKGFFEKVEKRK